jgi:formyl-CoA transferase
MMLGDMGADVIKVEPPEGGDQTRSAMGFKLKGDDSLGFLNLNRNKRSVTLDLKSEEGREQFYRLARTADVLVENYRPGVTKRLGIDYDSIRAVKPDIIYASISGFGQTGPWAGRPGFDLIAQAMSGVMSITGHIDGPPARCSVPVSDMGCALFALYGILSAYIGRQSTGEGQHIDAALFDAALAFSVWDVSEYWGTGKVPQPVGSGNRMSAPYEAVRAKDGYLVLAATNNKLWKLLCDVIGRPELVEDPRFARITDRLANRAALVHKIEEALSNESASHWLEKLMAAGIPAAPINTYEDALKSEQAAVRKMEMNVPHPVEGTYKSLGFPVKLSGTPQQVRRPPPLLGEHTAEVLAELELLGL